MNAPKTRPRTSLQLRRQFEAFQLHAVEGKNYRDISAQLGVDKNTVTRDIRHEGERRARELADERDQLVARSIARYEDVIAKARRKSAIMDAIAAKILKGGKDAPRSVNDRSLDTIVKALERIDKLLGLEAMPKTDAGLNELLSALAPRE